MAFVGCRGGNPCSQLQCACARQLSGALPAAPQPTTLSISPICAVQCRSIAESLSRGWAGLCDEGRLVAEELASASQQPAADSSAAGQQQPTDAELAAGVRAALAQVEAARQAGPGRRHIVFAVRWALPGMCSLAVALDKVWGRPEQQVFAAQVAAARSCAYLRCANLSAEGGPAAGAGGKKCRWVAASLQVGQHSGPKLQASCVFMCCWPLHTSQQAAFVRHLLQPVPGGPLLRHRLLPCRLEERRPQADVLSAGCSTGRAAGVTRVQPFSVQPPSVCKPRPLTQVYMMRRSNTQQYL